MASGTVLFTVTGQERDSIREAYGKTVTDIQQDIGIIKEWIETQPHLPEVPSDCMIETYLLATKFSIEMTKQHLDAYYSYRHIVPEFFRNVHPHSKLMQNARGAFNLVPLPNLTKDLYRIIFARINTSDPEFYIPDCVFAQALHMEEVRFQQDYNLGDIYVIDMEYMTMGHLVKITPTFLLKCRTVLEKVLANRIKGIHYVNGPSFMNTMVTIAKSILPPKLANRVYSHSDLQTLYQHIDRNLLPKDYGGEAPKYQDLTESFELILDQYRNRFDQIEIMETKEDLRPVKLSNDELLGFHGNFKKLNVD